METRQLGRTEMAIGAIALGTEYLIDPPRETVVAVVREAVERGVNYVDALFAYPHYRDNLGEALRGLRGRVCIAGHLGAAETDGQYRLTRDIPESEDLFHDLLKRLHTDYVDVLFLSNCDAEDDYRRVMGADGLLDLARQLQQKGLARLVGFSGHQVPTSLKAVESGEIDVLMHTVNFKADATPGRKDLFRTCAARNVGLIAMKPFAGGSLLRKNAPTAVTPAQCLAYALSRPGVTAVLPGVANLAELREDLDALTAQPSERDFSAVLPAFQKEPEGECCYCNHCLPCPAGIDIGKTTRLLDAAAGGASPALAAEYARLPAPASCLLYTSTLPTN